MNDYYDGFEQYDAVAEELKEALRASVTTEIKEQIEKLSTENRELKKKLKGLDDLEAAAKQAKYKYEQEVSAAKRNALSVVRQEKLAEILGAIDERLFTIEARRIERAKCDLCDETRRRPYLTPRGRKSFESCECSEGDRVFTVEECVAHEISRERGTLRIWWVAIARRNSDYGDELAGPRWLKPADSAEEGDLIKSPSNYSFKDSASAQKIADLANGKLAKAAREMPRAEDSQSGF